jgi:ABC-type multidrug transport system fused ATPase/permease subunit
MKSEKGESKKTKFRSIISYVKPYLGLEIGIALLMMIVVGLTLIDPLAMKIVIDDVIVDRNYSLLNVIVLALAALFLFRSAMRVITTYLIQFVSQRILFDIRFDLFNHLQDLHIDFFTKTRTGEIISRVRNDVARVQNVLTSTLISLITDVASIFITFFIIMYLNWKLTLMSLVVIPLFFISQFYLSRRIRKKSREVRDKSAEIVSFFEEVFSSIRLVQAFAKQKFESIRLIRKSKDLINLRIMLGILGGVAASVAGFLSAMGPMIVLWYGGREVMEGALSLGGLVAFYAYIGRLFRPILRIAQYNVAIQSARAAIDRIFEFMDVEPEIVDLPGSVKLGRVGGEIIFDNVNFAYNPGEPILSEVSFRIDPGQNVAIVGPSGVGKSTIVNLIERFYEPTSGRVLIDGMDIRKIKRNSLRRHIGLVSQNTVLFNATIRENILYGKKRATDEELLEAVSKADISDFISNLPDGFDTVVGERGLRLSGGQSQRVSIARTILKDPEILILDEAMSSLDTKSELLIHRALRPLMKGRTTIIVAHRLTSITDADIIFVLYRGRLEERGTHSELMNEGRIYRMLWDQMNLQISSEDVTT